jgi:hypothetical protein
MASANFIRAVALLTCAGLLSSPQAQLYKWTDANGKVHYSDTVPPEANDGARKQLSSEGVVRGQVERALTPEERRAAAVKADADRKAREIVEERERRDRALVSTYTSLADFDRVRDRALGVLDAEINGLTSQLTGLNNKRAELTKQIEATGKRGPSAKLVNDAKSLDADIVSVGGFESRKIRDRGEMAKNYATERARLADLMAAQAAATNATNAANPPAAPGNSARTKTK